MTQYKGYTIEEDKDFGGYQSGPARLVIYPTEEGIQHDYDYDNERYVYCGNSMWADDVEEAKEKIDAVVEKKLNAAAPDLLEAVGKIMESLNQSGSGFNWNTDPHIESAYQLCRKAYKKATE